MKKRLMTYLLPMAKVPQDVAWQLVAAKQLKI
jgi:hypothetical protein